MAGQMNRFTEPHELSDLCGDRHCWSHDVDEPIPEYAYQVCFECNHVYANEQELVDAFNRIVAEMNADGAQRYGKDHKPREMATSATGIHFCQHCLHDF